MKKIFLPLLTLALVIGSLSVQAQQSWVWDAYDVSLQLPEDFKVIKNGKNEFEAEGEGMEIYMFIFEEDISLNQMKDATLLAASEMELEQYDAVEEVSTSGFEGKYVAGYKEGDAVLLCGLIDPDNTTNFFVVITFDDDDGVAEADAFRILRSLSRS